MVRGRVLGYYGLQQEALRLCGHRETGLVRELQAWQLGGKSAMNAMNKTS